MTTLREALGRMKMGWTVGAIIVGAAAYGVISGGAAAAPNATPPAPEPTSPRMSDHAGPIMPGESLPPGHPPIDNMPANGRAETTVAVEGKVVEVLPAGRYSYLRFATPGGDTWAAVEGTVSVGARVQIVDATAMDGFTSATLGRKFDHIFFGVARPLGQ